MHSEGTSYLYIEFLRLLSSATAYWSPRFTHGEAECSSFISVAMIKYSDQKASEGITFPDYSPPLRGIQDINSKQLVTAENNNAPTSVLCNLGS